MLKLKASYSKLITKKWQIPQTRPKKTPLVYLKCSSGSYTAGHWQLPIRPNGFRQFITNTDRESMICMVSLPHVPSPTGQNQTGGKDQITDNMHRGLLCHGEANSRLQLCNFILTTVSERMSHVSPEWGKEIINCLEAASHKIGRWTQNDLMSSILPCTREDQRVFPQDLSQTVVQPCLCGNVQDHQDTMAKPFL